MALLPNTEYLHDRTHNYRLAVYFAAESARRLLNGVSMYEGYLTEAEAHRYLTLIDELTALMSKLDSTPIENITRKAGV